MAAQILGCFIAYEFSLFAQVSYSFFLIVFCENTKREDKTGERHLEHTLNVV